MSSTVNREIADDDGLIYLAIDSNSHQQYNANNKKQSQCDNRDVGSIDEDVYDEWDNCSSNGQSMADYSDYDGSDDDISDSERLRRFSQAFNLADSPDEEPATTPTLNNNKTRQPTTNSDNSIQDGWGCIGVSDDDSTSPPIDVEYNMSPPPLPSDDEWIIAEPNIIMGTVPTSTTTSNSNNNDRVFTTLSAPPTAGTITPNTGDHTDPSSIYTINKELKEGAINNNSYDHHPTVSDNTSQHSSSGNVQCLYTTNLHTAINNNWLLWENEQKAIDRY